MYAGWMLNGMGVVMSLFGFFLPDRRKWTCSLPLVLNAAPPRMVIGFMAVVFVLME